MSLSLPELLCEVLGEVCRHLDIEESAPGLLAALRKGFPVEGLLLWRWDGERSRLDAAAVVEVRLPEGGRVALTQPRREDLLRWARHGRAQAFSDREEHPISRLLVPEGLAGPVALGPLLEEGRLVGVLVLAGAQRADVERVQAVLEAFTTALANDRRVHELARLREAADADRLALLARLDRQDVSEAIVGEEAGLREVMLRVAQVAPTDAPVLILGETGSGKEVVARAIHGRSRRSGGPFLRVNCGAIPPELVDSELFGHEKGSFTGAIGQRKGWFERADGGTLFLDEIGELPGAAQVRLLRVLQDGSFQRVGGEKSHSVDVRIVAATHRDMAAMVRDGRFRQDLWYRVSVFPIRLPTLRERRGDIPALAAHFAERAGNRLFGRPITPLPEEVSRLQAYDWPGNVRELAAVIERAAILGGGRRLDLGTALGVAAGPAAAGEPGQDREAIESALRTCKGRIEGPFGAAQALGVNPHTLRSRMRKLGIEWERFRRRG